MKTVLIYDTLEAEITFYVVDGDRSHLNGKYVNSVDTSEKDSDEICELVFDENWNTKESLKEFPVDEVKNGALVVVVGFLS